MPSERNGHGDLESGGSRVKHIAAAHLGVLPREVRTTLTSPAPLCTPNRVHDTDGRTPCMYIDELGVNQAHGGGGGRECRAAATAHTRERRGAQGTRDGMRTSDLDRGQDARARRFWMSAPVALSAGMLSAPRDPVAMVRCRAQVHAQRVRRSRRLICVEEAAHTKIGCYVAKIA